MRTLVKWDPFREMSAIRRVMDGLFDESWTPAIWHERAQALPVDLYETEDAVVAKAALPGLNADDVEVSVTGDLLTIKGEAKQEEKEEREHYLRRELMFGAFRRTLPLPASVDSEKATAQYEDGVLTVTLPKSEGGRTKTIKVQSK